ncbi:UDP-N-acetylglucosamine 4,6-dehydratase (inverting) [Candidatus Collierbacteria bacterium]|nr:UDP-N-acetylglucosamine 4,6-dehydratase (inverting) [Candidatus Collierbacteria bacterium]
MLKSTILLTGGTGSFGRAFINFLLAKKDFTGTIRVFSRDEFKQYQLQQQYPDDLRLRFFIGDVRDKERLCRATHGANIIVHAAALKQIVVAEYNPFEVVKTNVLGSQNVVEAALDAKVKKTILISSDKAVHPINLYGATKMTAEKLFIQGNVYAGKQKTFFSVARYGNVLGSRGSVVPLFLKQKNTGVLTITHLDMTRFWITLPQAAKFVEMCLTEMNGGEIFIPKLPSVKITDLAKAVAPNAKIKIAGTRPGEKLHEELIAQEESLYSKEFKKHYLVIPPKPHWSKKQFGSFQSSTQKPFWYRSNNNTDWLSLQQIQKEVNTLKLQQN